MIRIFCLLTLLTWALPAAAQTNQSRPGLLLMAHGGSPEWNQAVRDAVRPLEDSIDISIAFGMVNPETLQGAVDELAAKNATAISVVRLFMSAESFLHGTEYAFGLRPDAPTGRQMHEPKVLDLGVPVALSDTGVMDDVSLGGVLADRARALSVSPRQETVLVIGHGPGSDDENARWLARMDHMVDSVRVAAPFHRVKVSTLREDWTGKRQVMEEELRSFVLKETEAGRTVLVVPFRLFGFGPYAEVFEGLSYRADGTGFLPDSRITDWIRTQYLDITHGQEARPGADQPK